MRKAIAAITLVLLTSMSAMAQKECGKQGQCPKMTAENCIEMSWKKAAKRLMLSDQQAEKVKPIYTDYVKEMAETCPKCKAMDKQKQPEKAKQKTEAEVKDSMKKRFAVQRKRLDIQEKYFDKFLKELNAYQAEYLVKAANKQCQQAKKMPKVKRGFFPQPIKPVVRPMGFNARRTPNDLVK